MSKQHLADMLKSIATNDMEAAKAHFNKYSTEKSQEILTAEDVELVDDQETEDLNNEETVDSTEVDSTEVEAGDETAEELEDDSTKE